jgi:T5SS/PEP-CTERM-associated repeat protein
MKTSFLKILLSAAGVSRRAFPLVIAAVMLAAPAVHGAITSTGNIYPSDPSWWISSADAYVGNTADGSLTVSEGSTIASLHAILGVTSGTTGTATITGAGSSWAMGNKLYVGLLGNGNLNITSGGTVTTGSSAALGFLSGSTGTVTVDGTGSAWTVNNTLDIGTAGTGTLNITNDGAVTVTGTTTLGTLGTINLNGGTLTTPTLSGSTSQLLGTGTLVTRNWTGDFDLIVDGITPTTQTAGHLTGTGQDITVKLDISGTSTSPLADLSVGYQNTGSLTITNGQTFASTGNYVGNLAGSTGTVIVDGAGSTWNANNALYVGYNGTGSASVTNGGTIATAVATLGQNAGSSGTLFVDGTGSKLTNSGTFTIGNKGTGILTITNGGTITNTNGLIGYAAGSSGTVNVKGAGSTWTNSGTLYVGNAGSGRMTIDQGGAVSNTGTYIAYSSGTSGTVIVNGAGSTWTNSGALYVGVNGTGSLSISAGGTVSATSVIVYNSSSVLTADVNSSLTVGSGSGAIANKGTIRLVAGASAAAGTYTPLAYSAMSGTGTVQALGGVWNASAHTVAVSGAQAAEGIGGATAAFNLAATQRVLITDTATGMSVGAGFVTGTASVTFGASAIGGSTLTALQGLLAAGESVVSGWDFSSTGYTVSTGKPVYLSLFAGSGLSLSDLEIWSYNGSTWSAFTANDLAYDGTYASFTAFNLNSYAVVDPPSSVPVPAAVWLLGSGLAGLVGMRRRLLKK